MGGSQVRQNCKVIPKHSVRSQQDSKEGDLEYSTIKHPDFLALMRSLDRFESWVNNRLIIIASKWIDEHRDEVIAGMSEADMNDMGVAIERAYELIEQSGWVDAMSENGKSVVISDTTHNLSWVRKTKEMIKGEKALD